MDAKNGDQICLINKGDEQGAEIDITLKLYTRDGKVLINATPDEISLPSAIQMSGNTFTGLRTAISINSDGTFALGIF